MDMNSRFKLLVVAEKSVLIDLLHSKKKCFYMVRILQGFVIYTFLKVCIYTGFISGVCLDKHHYYYCYSQSLGFKQSPKTLKVLAHRVQHFLMRFFLFIILKIHHAQKPFTLSPKHIY